VLESRAAWSQRRAPDLDELWRDSTQAEPASSAAAAARVATTGPATPAAGPNFQPNLRSAGVGAALIAGVVVLIWLGSGVFIVQEGQQAVVTSFGRFSHTVDAGFQWRFRTRSRRTRRST
jgi:membrane protease subunit HflK